MDQWRSGLTPKLFIAVPSFGHVVYSQTAVSLFALVQQLTLREIKAGISALSFPDIADLRNVFLSVFYDAIDATHILFIDADMGFEPELIFDMLAADKQIIGAIYPQKKYPLNWVGSALDPQPLPENGILELEGLGCGVMLIRRDAITQMIEAGNVEIDEDMESTALSSMLEPHGVKRLIKAFDKVTTETGRKLSEDFSFCYRHRKSGGKVYAAIEHTLMHVGPHIFTARYSDMYGKVEEH